MKTRKKNLLLKTNKFSKFDYPLFIATLFLTIFGILMVYNASVVEAYRDFSDKFYFAKQQVMWSGIGIVLMMTISFVPYKTFRKLGPSFYLFSLISLLMVLIPAIGTKVQGARRWINVFGVTIQPAEIVKLTLTMYLAAFLEKKTEFGKFLFVTILSIGLIMLEPDLGTAIVASSIAGIMYFISGAPIRNLLLLITGGLVSGVAFIATSTYRRARVATFFNPTNDPLGASYHIRQILIALGLGGIFGVGIGQSRQKFEYIPAATTDSIFAIISEEIGFIGSAFIILVFIFIIIRSFKIAKQAPDKFSQLLASGIASWIGVQTILNLSTIVALVPITGVPLPFISYGGSATISTLAGMGVLLNISRFIKEG